MKRFNTYLRSVLCLFAVLFVSTSSYASHILAMDLYYTWVSGNTYKITVVLYGDCSPASRASGAYYTLPTSSPQICIFRGNTNVQTINLTLQLQGVDSGVDITPVCPSEVGLTQCEDPSSTIPGIKQFVYSANYTLPAPVSGLWQFAYFGNNGSGAQAGRSASITNMVNPGNTIMELVDTLDNTVFPNNSSAQFSVIPTPFFCLNLPDSYNPGAVAHSGDSLSVVNLITAMDASAGGFGGPCQFGNPVTYAGTAWNPPFRAVSDTTPLNVVAGSYTYDVTTGQLNFKPNAIQRSTVVYNVRAFRSGSFVGSSQREMNFLVQSCVSTPPTGGISGVSNGIIADSAQLITCGNSGPFSFTFDPREPGTTNDITVTWSGLPATAITPTITVINNGTTTPHVTFLWTSTGVPPGTYIFYLTYTDNNCPLQGTNTTAISIDILPTATVTDTVITPITCSPKEVINIIPGGTGSPWTVTVKGTNPGTFTPVSGTFIDSLSPGSDTISITSAATSRCNTADTVKVLSPAIIGDTPVCVGAKIILSDAITGGTWSSGNTSMATVVMTGSASGTVTGVSGGLATITYSFPQGCFKTVTVTVKPLPSAISGTLHACTGLTTALSDALAGGFWSSGSSAIATIGSATGIVTGVTAGTAIISYTDNGCSITNSVIVNKEPSVTSGSPNICTDGTTTLTVTPSGGTWSISNTGVATITATSASTATISGLHNNGTTVVIYALSGCSFFDTITAVSVLPPITGPSYVCTGQSIVLSNTITGGTWTSTNSAVATADAHAGAIIGVSPGVPTISYTIGGSCTTSETITVRQSPDHGTIIGLANVCVGEKIILSDTISGGTWGMFNDSATVSHDTVTGIFPGKDTVWYIVTNAFCRDTATKPITIYRVPVVGPITGQHVLCIDTMVILTDTTRGGAWSSSFTSIATINFSGSGVVTGISAGIDTIKYTLSNPGCSTIASYTITVYTAPVPGIITGLPSVCAGSVFVLSDTTGGVWNSSNITVATHINNTTGVVNALNAGTTTIHYTIGPNAGRCYGIATVVETITPQNTLTINSTVSQVTCYGDNNGSISVSVSGSTSNLQYLWSNNATTASITGLSPGFDTLHVTEPLTLCYASDNFQITQPDSLHVSDTTTQDKCKQSNGTVTAIVTGGTLPYTYLWSDNSTGSSLENLSAGTYTVTVTDNNNCTQTIVAEVTNNDCIINVHDVITPNGDGINDTWIIEGIDNYPENTVQVFDKWGDRVYEKSNYNNDWNGKGNSGAELPDGTYFYLVKLNAKNLLGTQNTWNRLYIDQALKTIQMKRPYES